MNVSRLGKILGGVLFQPFPTVSHFSLCFSKITKEGGLFWARLEGEREKERERQTYTLHFMELSGNICFKTKGEGKKLVSIYLSTVKRLECFIVTSYIPHYSRFFSMIFEVITCESTQNPRCNIYSISQK